MQFVTSDIHFNHRAILKYCPHRNVDNVDVSDAKNIPDSAINKMNELIISNWNSKVKPEDEVFILGDVAMGLIDRSPALIRRLNGTKHLIAGNHDVKLVKMCKNREPGFENLFASIDRMKNITVTHNSEKYPFVMCHFPLVHWEKQNHGAIQLYGHMHSDPDKRFLNEWRQMDIGMDGNNLRPYSLEEIMEIMVDRKIKDVDHHD